MSRPPSPTNTEWQTFQVMANPNFVNIRAPKPTFRESPKEQLHEITPPSSPIDDNLESISVVAERLNAESFNATFKPILETHAEVEEDESDDDREPEKSDKREEPLEKPREEPDFRVEIEDDSKSTFQANGHSNDSQTSSSQEKPKVSAELREKARKMNEHDILLEKEGLLSELEMMTQQGIIKLQRELTIRDSLEDIQFQYDRAMANQNAMQTVEMAKTSIKGVSMLLQMAFAKMGLKLLDGFSDHLCKDMNRFNRPLTRMQRKYWRGTTLSAETELAMIVFGSVLVTIMHNKGLGMFVNMMPNMMGGAGDKPASAVPPMARPMPAPAPGNFAQSNPMHGNHQGADKPSIPVMRRPQSSPSVAPDPPATRTVHLPTHSKPARKRNDEPVINL